MRQEKLESKYLLLQRGYMEPRSYKKGIDSLVRWDYMGSAEFEFGALPESLGRIRKSIDSYYLTSYHIVGKEFNIFCDESYTPTVQSILEVLSLSGSKRYQSFPMFSLKEQDYFDCYFSKKGRIYTPDKLPDFWWEIKEDWMVWVAGDKKFNRMFVDAMFQK